METLRTLRLLSISLVLFLIISGCAALPKDNPQAMIQYYSGFLGYGGSCARTVGLTGSCVFDASLNRCREYLKIEAYSQAISDCSTVKSLPLSSGIVGDRLEATWMLAKAYIGLDDFESAIYYLRELKESNGICTSENPEAARSLWTLGGALELGDWRNCDLIEAYISDSNRRLSDQRAKNREYQAKLDALAAEQRRVEAEQRRIEEERIAAENARLERKERLEREAAAARKAAKERKLKAHLEKQERLCLANKGSAISTVFWEAIVIQFGLDPRSRDYEVTSSSSAKVGIWGLMAYELQGPDEVGFWCDITIYLDKGICKAQAQIIEASKLGEASIFGSKYIFHNDFASPCRK